MITVCAAERQDTEPCTRSSFGARMHKVYMVVSAISCLLLSHVIVAAPLLPIYMKNESTRSTNRAQTCPTHTTYPAEFFCRGSLAASKSPSASTLILCAELCPGATQVTLCPRLLNASTVLLS